MLNLLKSVVAALLISVTPVPPNGIYVSAPHIEYRPIVISMQGVPAIKSFEQLGKYKLATFQGAIGYFGKELQQASKMSPAYIEHHDMGKLVSLLVQKRTDAVLLDYSIFQLLSRPVRVP
jgi:ABC-type amino acid transport substrate-binding protein